MFKTLITVALLAMIPLAYATPSDEIAQQRGADTARLQKIAPFTVPALPYAADALAPAISGEIMRIHHDRHHQGYVDNLNKAVAGDSALKDKTLAQLLAMADRVPVGVRNNAGGHYNHALFWTLLAPAATGGQPNEALAAAITRDFGSMDQFKASFYQAASGVFGSGWTWLIIDASGRLKITTTPNQDNPLMPDVKDKGTPILALDVWEHAYYLSYQNKRADYIKAWWSVVNWNEANGRFEAGDTN